MTRQLPARNYRLGVAAGWGIFAECAHCVTTGTTAPGGLLTTAADLMGYAHMHERIYHPELREPAHRAPVDDATMILPVLNDQSILDHQIWSGSIKCSDDACPCEDGGLDLPANCTVGNLVGVLMLHRKDFPPATRNGAPEPSPELLEAWQESKVGAFGVTPVEYAESRARHPGYVPVPPAEHEMPAAPSLFTGPHVVRHESRASCIACRCPVERHRGDLGCLDCPCTHPTGVA